MSTNDKGNIKTSRDEAISALWWITIPFTWGAAYILAIMVISFCIRITAAAWNFAGGIK